MSLGVAVAASKSGWAIDPELPSADVSEAVFLFLYPYLQRLERDAGILIDLYEDADIQGGDRVLLEQVLLDALQLAATSADPVQVLLGHRVQRVEGASRDPVEERVPVHVSVPREELGERIQKVLAVVQSARENQRRVLFLGD